MAEAWRGVEVDEGANGPVDSPVPAGYGPLGGPIGSGQPSEPAASTGAPAPVPEAPPLPVVHGPHGNGAPDAEPSVVEEEPPATVPVAAAPAPAPAPPPASALVEPRPMVDVPPAPPPPAEPVARRTRTVSPSAPPRGRPTRDDEVVTGPVRGRLRPRQEVRVVRGTRTRRLVRRIDVFTVFKVSVAFYLLAMLTLLIAGTVVWNVADAFGLITSVQKSVRTLFSLKTFTLHAGSVFGWSLVIGGVLCVFGALLNTLLATIYNLISDVVGGIQVVVVSETEGA